MKLTAGLFIFFLLLIDPGKIGQINTLKADAKKAYTSGDYKTAAEKYSYLVEKLNVREDEVMMNMANAYFHLNDTSHTTGTYQELTTSTNTKIKSTANQQLGVMKNKQGNSEEALQYFKQALRADPSNEEARYNYELVKKKLEEKKKNEDKDKNKSKEPSEFAKKLKAQADQLVFNKLYNEANKLMEDGLAKDQSVSFYQKFIKRTKEVSTIK